MQEGKPSLDELRIDHDEPEPGRRAGLILLAVVMLLVMGGVAGYWQIWLRAPEVRCQAAQPITSAGGRQVVLNASGYVVARRQATVSSKMTGKVAEVLVEEGMRVEEGQVLARLDAANVTVDLNLARAQLEAARGALNETQVRLEETERELARVLVLEREGVASASDLDRAQADVDSLRARLHLQSAQVTVAERQVAVLEQYLEDTVIRAPFSGIAVSKNAQPGEMISPVSAGGGFTRTGIGTIVDMSSLEIEVDVNESYIHRVTPAQAVEAALDAYPDWKLPCRVIAIIPTADRQKATVQVRVGFDQLDPRILPQMGVKVGFLAADDSPAVSDGVLVPKAALRNAGGRDTVLVLEGDRVRSRPVTVTLQDAAQATVVAGLVAGERVVVDGPPELADGARVRESSR